MNDAREGLYAEETEGDDFETQAECVCILMQVAGRYTAGQAWFAAAHLAAHALAYEVGGRDAVKQEVDRIANELLVMLRFHHHRLMEERDEQAE
jgi:hypothetical protein